MRGNSLRTGNNLQAVEKIKATPIATYDGYDYSTFWENRAYENASDEIAIRRLLKKLPHRIFGYKLIDIGAGMGRLTHVYEHLAEKIILLDPSLDQLKHAKRVLPPSRKYEFAVGTVESIPFRNNSSDLAISVRVSHYVPDMRQAIKEVARVLTPGGYFIVEIPNKIHMKARIKGIFSKNATSEKSISRSISGSKLPFLNHHPITIHDILIAEQFEIADILSVSNFRSPSLKAVIPRRVLLIFEWTFQRPLAKFWFGPSIYFLARKKDHEIA